MASKRPAFRENIHRLFDEAQAVDLAPGIVSLIESNAIHAQIREIPITKILPNPAQPRLSYEEDSLTELADSIREHGVLQPILVRPVGAQYELIAGERRWRASGIAQRETIPAIVAEFDDQTALEVSIIENLQREDVSPLEEAAMFRKMTDLGYSVRTARPEDRQGQGLRREPHAPGRCAAGDSRAGVRAQRHDQPRLRADEDHRRADASPVGQEGGGRRADARASCER